VEHGKNSQQRVRGADLDDREDGVRFAHQIGVGKHHAFRVGGGAGGVEQRGQIAFGRYDGLIARRGGGEYGIQIGSER
jgi:hypothetical protein